MRCLPRCRFQPVLVDLDIDGIAGSAGIVGPYLALNEADAIERKRRQAVAAIGQLLGIRKVAAQALHHARFAADKVRRAQMAGWIGAPHRHGIAGLEARAHADSLARRLTSVMRRPSSSVVITPRSTRARAIEAIQRS